MANLPSFEELLRTIPEEKQHLLDSEVEDYQLAEIAINLTRWQDIVPYLGLKEAEETAIEENYHTAERRRLVPCVHCAPGFLEATVGKPRVRDEASPAQSVRLPSPEQRTRAVMIKTPLKPYLSDLTYLAT